MFANAIIAAGLCIVATCGLLAAESRSQSEEVLGFFVAAGWFIFVAGGFATRSRLLVAIASVPVILAACILFLVLIFAELVWSPQGVLTARILQAVSLVIIVLQILGIITVFGSQRKHRSSERDA